MPAEIISVGTELLLGQITDTNATFISERLAEIGVDAYFRTTVGDNLERITDCIRHALGRADVIILSGGLGPTTDDLTKEAMAAALGLGLTRDEAAAEHVRSFFRERGREMVESNLKQADFPDGASPIPNPCGTAPGVCLPAGERILFAVPGVPREMRTMIADQVIPELRRRGYAGQWVIRSKVLKLVGIGESSAAQRVQDLIDTWQNPTIAPLAGGAEVSFRITAKKGDWQEAGEAIDEVERLIRCRVGEFVYGCDEKSLPEVVIEALCEREQTLATAESCTGGLIASRLTDVSGSSRCFIGGVVSYSNESKTEHLGVPGDVLAEHGAVSAQVAELMAAGVRRRFGADFGVSATGIAGPTGATETKPVGLVYIALAHEGGVSVERHMLVNDRLVNKLRASQAALDLIRRTLGQGSTD